MGSQSQDPQDINPRRGLTFPTRGSWRHQHLMLLTLPFPGGQTEDPSHAVMGGRATVWSAVNAESTL